MAAVPTTKNTVKLPVFQCGDKGLESALNILARAIEGINVPDVRLPAGAGTMEWSGNDVLLRPAQRITSNSPSPWTPKFESDGTQQSLVSFHLGTINGVVPANWSQKHQMPQLTEGQFKYITLTVTTQSGGVTGSTISLEDTPVTEERIAKSVPPTQFEVVLGVLYTGGFFMNVNYNLQALATVAFQELRIPVGPGESPKDNWYVWQVGAMSVNQTLYS